MSAPDLLRTIVAATERITATRRERESLAAVEKRAAGMSPRGQGFEAELGTVGRINVIAECKRRSPSKGVLAADYDAVAIARLYEQGGAAAISVLTEPRHWGGSIEDLADVRAAVAVPVLCKDVIVDERQILAARASGADAVLLIGEALDDRTLASLLRVAESLGMGVLMEAHEAAAFDRVLATGAILVGVNARNLRLPAEIRPGRIPELAGLVTGGRVLDAESGLGSAADVRALPGRVGAILVGTALVRADDPAPLLRELANARGG